MKLCARALEIKADYEQNSESLQTSANRAAEDYQAQARISMSIGSKRTMARRIEQHMRYCSLCSK